MINFRKWWRRRSSRWCILYCICLKHLSQIRNSWRSNRKSQRHMTKKRLKVVNSRRLLTLIISGLSTYKLELKLCLRLQDDKVVWILGACCTADIRVNCYPWYMKQLGPWFMMPPKVIAKNFNPTKVHQTLIWMIQFWKLKRKTTRHNYLLQCNHSLRCSNIANWWPSADCGPGDLIDCKWQMMVKIWIDVRCLIFTIYFCLFLNVYVCIDVFGTYTVYL